MDRRQQLDSRVTLKTISTSLPLDPSCFIIGPVCQRRARNSQSMVDRNTYDHDDVVAVGYSGIHHAANEACLFLLRTKLMLPRLDPAL